MDDTPINLENILEQAPKWTFAGDFTLLQWMNQISQDLETRATKTTEALTKLNNNVRSTNIALDNVANSLTTLQFGNQFVECRVQDDDETLANANEASSDGGNPIEHTPTSKEMLNKFLDNNLKVLRNCHEKYSIDLDDSDEEDEGKSKEKTCIYQPINPYNEKPLPYIFGSKDWQAKWHVGLYENQEENSYSGDEMSEAFSESSSTSHLEDNESFESNTEWASSNSIDNDNLNTNIEVKNASSLRGSQPLYPGTPSIPISAIKNKVAAISESSSLSTPSSSSAKKSTQTAKQNENLTHRSESINSINSKNSSIKPAKVSSSNKENNMQYKPPPQAYVDLFAEPPDDLESTTSSSVSSAQNIIRPPDTNQAISSDKTSTFRTQPPPFVDLFAEPPEDIPSSTTSSSMSSGRNVKRKMVNLFDDDEDDMAKDDLLSVLTKKEELIKPKADEKKMLPPTETNVIDKPLNVTKTLESIDKHLSVSKTPKSLFEDSDDEDDDFLKAFVQRPSSKETNKTSLTKTMLFDNDFPEPTSTIKSLQSVVDNADFITPSNKNDTNHKIRNIFNDAEDNDEELFVNKRKESKTPIQKPMVAEESDKTAGEKENAKKSVNLFDDFEDALKIGHVTAEKKTKKLNLFDDLEDEDGEDLFSKKPKPTSIKDLSQESTLRENIAKSDEVVKEKNITASREIYSESIAKKSNQTNDLMKTFEEINQSNTNALEGDVVEQKTSEPETRKEIRENKENTVSDENESIEPTQAKSTNIEDKLLSNIIENQSDSSNLEARKSALENNDSVENTNNEPALAKPISIEDKIHSKQNNFETLTESSNLETKQSAQDHKELNNNDTISTMQEKAVSVTTNETQKTNSSNKYDFNSILLFDEPPEDDDAFFETLAKAPQALSTNYNAIDLEHDIFEPELPKVPVTSANSNQTDSSDTRQTSLYTGLQLFSDVPPDDDIVNDDSNIPTENNQTKRLHSVFYDDFNETLMALNQNQIAKENPTHLLVSDEPPPINEELNSSPNNDTIDHDTVPALKQEVTNDQDQKLKGSQIASKLEEVLSKSSNKNAKSSSTKRPVSKLQMPHININVQALLPGANNTLRKTKDDTTKANDIEPSLDDIKPANIVTKQTAEVPRTAETEHILPSVTKNRVRAPATRRPSTRRARQENYRKSLMEEEPQTFGSDDEKSEVQNENSNLFKTIKTQTKTNIPNTSTKQVQPQNKIENQKQTTEKKLDAVAKINQPSVLIDDKPAVNANIFNVSKSKTLEIKSETNILKAVEVDKNIEKSRNSTDIFEHVPSLHKLHKNDEIKAKPAPAKSLLFFDDEDGEEDDLFKHIKTSKTAVNKAAMTVPKSEARLPVKSSIQSDDTNLTAHNTNREVTKDIPAPTTLNAPLPGVATTVNDNKNQKPTNEDDLFVEDPDSTTSQTSQIRTKTEITNKPSTTTGKSLFLDNYGDELHRRTDQKPSTSNSFKDRNHKAKAQFRSFLDSESDEDLNVAGLPSKTATSNTAAAAASSKTPNVSSVFGDSDTDSDDLFGKIASTKASNHKHSTEPTTKTQIKATAKASSLFSDESDGDGDFLTSSVSVSKNTVSKSSLKENKQKITTQTNTSLFSDVDSDEDDLFGSGAAKVANTSATTIPSIKKPTTSKPIVTAAEFPKPKPVADNPLADLL